MRRIVALCLVAAVAGGQAGAQDAEPLPAPAPPVRASEPRLTNFEAQVLGAVAGLTLGAALSGLPKGETPALTPLGEADAIVAGSAVALFGAGFLARKSVEPDSAPGDVNAFDRKVRRFAVGGRSFEKRRLLDHISSATLMAAVFQPIGMLAAGDVANRWSRDIPVMLEATALTLSVNNFVKYLARRSRPEDHFCEEEQIVVPCRADTHLSFYSGHTSAAFVAAVTGGMLADFHRLENRKWIWASGITLATATGALRVASDQHYATDVLTGVVAGSLAGWLIPKIHKPDPLEPAAARTGPPPSTAVPVVLQSGRSTAVVSVGSVGGGPYVGVQLRW